MFVRDGIMVAAQIICMLNLMVGGATMVLVRIAGALCISWHHQESGSNQKQDNLPVNEAQSWTHTYLLPEFSFEVINAMKPKRRRM